MQVNVLATYTVSSHEYTLSEHIAVAHSADSLHLDTFPTTHYALPYTTRFLDTSTNSMAVKETQCSGPFPWIKPKLETIWACYSGTQCWLVEHVKSIQLEPVIQGSSTPGETVLPRRQVSVLATCRASSHEYTLSEHTAVAQCWLAPPSYFFSPCNMLHHGHKFPQHLKNSSSVKATQCSVVHTCIHITATIGSSTGYQNTIYHTYYCSHSSSSSSGLVGHCWSLEWSSHFD